jgi:FMN phosphatase YigB (HAD superfamily)
MRCLDHNGLRFDLVVDSETARCYKPDPPIFRRACQARPVPASEAVMVGDTPETDIQSARQTGQRRHRRLTRFAACASLPAGGSAPLRNMRRDGEHRRRAETW